MAGKEVEILLRVPGWANWIAQNREGDYWAFARKPKKDPMHERWHHTAEDINEPCMRIAVEVGPVEDWEKSLEEVK